MRHFYRHHYQPASIPADRLQEIIGCISNQESVEPLRVALAAFPEDVLCAAIVHFTKLSRQEKPPSLEALEDFILPIMQSRRQGEAYGK